MATRSATFSPTFYGDDTGSSDEVQLVLNRYSALSQTETDAITAFVDGLVADGVWNNITEVYAPCLNATDFLIGMKFMNLIPSASPPAHVAGEGVDFTDDTQYYRDSINFLSFATIEGFVGVYNVFTEADSTPADLFGVQSGPFGAFLQWRFSAPEYFSLYNVDSATPVSAATARPTGDFIGIGFESPDAFDMAPGGVIFKSTKTALAVPPNFEVQWHGINQDGSSTAVMTNSRYSLMLHSNGLLSDQAQLLVRPRVLQFLRDIGVTGIPVT